MKCNFNLEAKPNINGEHLIFLNLSFGVKKFNPKTNTYKYIPLRISTECSIQKEYWIGKPTYRSNEKYVRIKGKDLNNTLHNIQTVAENQLKNYRSAFGKEPSIEELKKLVLKKLNRKTEPDNDMVITKYITKSVNARTTVEITSDERWSKATGKQYLNLKEHIEMYEQSKKVTLTFRNLTGETFKDFFREINLLYFAKNNEYYANNTIAKVNKHFRALLNCAKEDKITIGFDHTNGKYQIKRREINNEVYLTTAQLATIINADTSHSQEFTHAKNYLILSSFTGLRIGDMVLLHEIKPVKLIHDSKEYDCIVTRIRKVQQNKDELTSTIPLLAPVKEYLKQNDNKFPKFPSQTNIRKYIKKFLTYLEIDDSIEIKKYYFMVDDAVKSQEKLCAVFSPHDCRSTFISNLKDLDILYEIIEPITHPKNKKDTIVKGYDRTTPISKAVSLINALALKNSPLYKY